MSHSVLVVEDHHELRTMIDHMLTRHGYDVFCASTVAEAVTRLHETHPPCLILWDPTSLPMNSSLITLAGHLGVHIATIPVGIAATGQTEAGLPVIAKKLTSLDAIVSVLREHCPLTDAQAPA
jgi:CheY-like chemotaxis protein